MRRQAGWSQHHVAISTWLTRLLNADSTVKAHKSTSPPSSDSLKLYKDQGSGEAVVLGVCHHGCVGSVHLDAHQAALMV